MDLIAFCGDDEIRTGKGRKTGVFRVGEQEFLFPEKEFRREPWVLEEQGRAGPFRVRGIATFDSLGSAVIQVRRVVTTTT
jgi:hypothetical protein